MEKNSKLQAKHASAQLDLGKLLSEKLEHDKLMKGIEKKVEHYLALIKKRD